jgi:hypothetical protein
MKKFAILYVLFLIVTGCSTSNVTYTRIDESYVVTPKPANADIVLIENKVKRPHHVIGVIEAHLGKNARRVELNALMIKKAREIGADGIMLVEYDIDPTVYVSKHHALVGKGPFKHHVVKRKKHVKVEKTANGIAVIFK